MHIFLLESNDFVARVEQNSQKYGFTKLGIFGSVARKENTEGGDIDIVVEVEKPSIQRLPPPSVYVEHFTRCYLCLIKILLC